MRARLGVVVPVHDEEALLGPCLDALATAARAAAAQADVRVVVVLDACTDGSAAIAARHAVEVVTGASRRVGVVRAAGCARLLDPAAGPPADWLATTDADSVVPADWLHAQVDALRAGDDARVGTVRVGDWGRHPEVVRRWFREVYDHPDDVHPHVHGANLGVRASAYRAVGGFAPLVTGEDVALVAALEARGARVRRTRHAPVLTSTRVTARAVAGFADHLLRLGSGGSPRRDRRAGAHA